MLRVIIVTINIESEELVFIFICIKCDLEGASHYYDRKHYCVFLFQIVVGIDRCLYIFSEYPLGPELPVKIEWRNVFLAI